MFDFLVYNKFKSKKWAKLSPQKRLKIFQKVEKIMARKMHREVYQIIPKEWNDGTYGLCVHAERVIYLNTVFFLDDNMRFFGLATLFHEERHAQQHAIVKSKKKLFKLSKAYRWQKNMQGYISYDGNEKYSYYSMQEIERDANKYAINRLKHFKFRYRHEDLFTRTLDAKIKQFADTKDLAKKELGFFYRIKLLLRERKERKKNERE